MVLLASFLVLIPGGDHRFASAQEDQGENIIITSDEHWNDTMVRAISIEIKDGARLIIENVSIIMNNTSSIPTIVNHGTLIMNGSRIIPTDYDSDDRYRFKSYGACELNGNNITKPNNLEFFTDSVRLNQNTIFNSSLDSIYIKGERDPSVIATFIDNTIIDAGQNGFRFLNSTFMLSENRILGTEKDGLYIKDSIVTLNEGEMENIKGNKVSIGLNSELRIYQDTLITTRNDIHFLDQTSLVKIWTDNDDVITIYPPKPDSTSGSFFDQNKLIIAISIFVVLIITTLILDRWNEKKFKGKKKHFIPSVEVGEAAKEEDEPVERVEKRKAGVQEEFGDMALDGGSYEAAIEYYERALTLNERRDEIMVKKGGAYEKMGRHQEALECYEEALEVNDRNKEAIEGRQRYIGLIKSRTQATTETEQIADPIPSPEKNMATPIPSLEKKMVTPIPPLEKKMVTPIPPLEKKMATTPTHSVGKKIDPPGNKSTSSNDRKPIREPEEEDELFGPMESESRSALPPANEKESIVGENQEGTIQDSENTPIPEPGGLTTLKSKFGKFSRPEANPLKKPKSRSPSVHRKPEFQKNQVVEDDLFNERKLTPPEPELEVNIPDDPWMKTENPLDNPSKNPPENPPEEDDLFADIPPAPQKGIDREPMDSTPSELKRMNFEQGQETYQIPVAPPEPSSEPEPPLRFDPGPTIERTPSQESDLYGALLESRPRGRVSKFIDDGDMFTRKKVPAEPMMEPRQPEQEQQQGIMPEESRPETGPVEPDSRIPDFRKQNVPQQERTISSELDDWMSWKMKNKNGD